MKKYKLSLELEFSSTDPLAAAKEFVRMVKEDGNTYIFTVQEDDTDALFSVDLSESDEDAVLPNNHYDPLIVENPARIEDEKKRMIKHIRDIIKKHGPTSSMELELDASPCLSTIGNNKDNVSQLIENFNEDTVMCVTYHGEHEIDSERRAYDGLPDDILAEIENIMIDYDSAEEQTYKRISN